jgi:hypothetical protein
MFFGCAVNLTESLYLAHLGTHKEKEALSGFAGFTLS